DFCKQRVVLVYVAPSHLDEPNPIIGKVINHAPDAVGSGDEIRIEYQDQVARGLLEPLFQGAGLEANPFIAVSIAYIQALIQPAPLWGHTPSRECVGLNDRSPKFRAFLGGSQFQTLP